MEGEKKGGFGREYKCVPQFVPDVCSSRISCTKSTVSPRKGGKGLLINKSISFVPWSKVVYFSSTLPPLINSQPGTVDGPKYTAKGETVKC